MGVVARKRVIQARFKSVGRIAIAALETTPRQDAKPPFHLVEPGAMFGGKVEDLLLGRITQQGTPLPPAVQGLHHQRPVAPLGHQPADREAPGRLELIHHPVVARPSGELLDDVGQMRGEVLTPRCQTTCPVATTNEAIKARTPCRLYACSRFSGWPGARGCGGYWRGSICLPVFASLPMTTRPCSKQRRALRYQEPRWCALASKSGSWLLRQ
jgi:hypothetical protein